METYEDPNDEGNSSRHHTGRQCVESGCTEPAGTAWSPWWCFKHNVERIRQVDESMKRLEKEVT